MKHTRLALIAALAATAVAVTACSDGEPTGPASTPAATAASATAAVADVVPQGDFDFPTGPAVLVEVGYEPPGDHVPSTGAYLPANGKPTLVFVDAIWCPPCALTRPAFHDLRHEYQDRVNLVILDYDLEADGAFADELGVRAHPAWAFVAPDSDEVVERKFGPLHESALREWLTEIIAQTEAGPGA
ncbi:MAG: TlpA family protein disulfide reductase [Dehalococcoidia bacterium]